MRKISKFEEWKLGGVRYRRLRERLPRHVSPSEIRRFCVVVHDKGPIVSLLNFLIPLQREYVVVATSNEVTVLRLRRPGAFSATIIGTETNVVPGRTAIEWHDRSLVIDGTAFRPVAFHRKDAEEIARFAFQPRA